MPELFSSFAIDKGKIWAFEESCSNHTTKFDALDYLRFLYSVDMHTNLDAEQYVELSEAMQMLVRFDKNTESALYTRFHKNTAPIEVG